MHTAVVILNWNGAQMLRKYLPSVIKFSEGAEIIVADNASTDESMEVMRQDFPEVRTIVLDQNYGFAEGYNRALQQVEAEVYVLLNSDVEVTAHWLSPMLHYLEAHPECGACQPKLLQGYPDELASAPGSQATTAPRFEYAGAAGGFIDWLGYPFCRGRVFGEVEEDHGQYDTTVPIFWASGAALVIRAKDWHEAGGLDARFFAHQEEIDLCWRLKARGREIVCCPQSVVYHLGGGTLPQGNPRKTYLNFRNNLLLLYKNLPDSELRPILRWRKLLDAVAALKELLTLNFEGYLAIRRARRDFKRTCHDFDTQRAENLSRTTLYNIRERAHVSVLWQYYVKRKKTFSDLQ